MLEGSEIFDRALLYERRSRLARMMAGQTVPDFLLAHASDDLIDRLSMIKRTFHRALLVGGYHGLVAQRMRVAGVKEVIETEAVPALAAVGGPRDGVVIVDEEALQFEPRTFDLAVSVLAMQYVNDLPGVLSQIQRLLKPDGLFIGVALGGMTLGELRQAMLAAEAEVKGGASPRIMPFVDVRDAGGLLQRAGFALPVADAETVTVTYRSALDLMGELKGMGATNVLRERSRVPMTRGLLMRAADIYAERFPASDGKGRVSATFEFVTMTGWVPDPSQQKPLKPGSAKFSLAEALKPGGGRGNV